MQLNQKLKHNLYINLSQIIVKKAFLKKKTWQIKTLACVKLGTKKIWNINNLPERKKVPMRTPHNKIDKGKPKQS